MQWVREVQRDVRRERLYRSAIGITLAGNILLAVVKALAAVFSGSVALYADAANSASDVFYSFTIAFGLWMALQPPDLSHPQGHHRFEPLVGLVVAGSMTVAGYVAIRAAIERFVSGAVAIEPGLPTLTLVGSATVKVWMYWSIRRIAQALNSPTFKATAQDNLSDVLTSMAAFIGALGSKWVHPWFDPVAGGLVALWIFKNAAVAWRSNLAFLTGAGASQELREQIAEISGSVPGVRAVHQVIAEYVGPRLVADLHINVSGDLTLREAHAIADEVERRLSALDEVDRAYVHVEPCPEEEDFPCSEDETRQD